MTKKIQLSQGKYVEVDDEDFEYLNQWKWHTLKIKHTVNHDLFYAGGHDYSKGDKFILMHRIIMNAKKGQIIDHIDGNGLNNKKSNLRFVTHRQNMQNRIQKKSSKYVGVFFQKDRGKYRSKIKIDGKSIHLGYFNDEYKAHLAYLEALEYIENGKKEELINLKTIKRGTNKHKGVYQNKKSKKWRVQITFKGKSKYIGSFSNERKAIKAHDEAVIKYANKKND